MGNQKSRKLSQAQPKGPFRTKNATTIAKIVNCYAVVFLLRPPNLLRRGPLFERKNVCNSQENGVRTRCAAIVNQPALLKILCVVNLLRVVFLVRRGPLGGRLLWDIKSSYRSRLQGNFFKSFRPPPPAPYDFPLVAPYCAIPRDYLSDTPLLRAMGFSASQHCQLGAIPPPPFLSISPMESMRSGGAIPPPPPKGVSQRYLRDTL